MIDFEELLHTQIEKKYYTKTDFKYKKEPGLFMSPFDVEKFFQFKDDILKDRSNFVELPLKTFNSKAIYYIEAHELKSYLLDYFRELNNDIHENGTLISDRLNNTILTSRLYSEIEGSLNIENVPTTRKRLKELIEKDAKPLNQNDIIIKNMNLGIKFIETKPEFNKENLFKLYSILSKDCLLDENKLHSGDYYRYDGVEVGGYYGCPSSKIEECMDSLFEYVKTNINSKNNIYLPHICHYYIIYIHPYFDYNGRTARMVSLWINMLINKERIYPPVISEAINQTKNKYYEAIEDSRDAHNDITYFLIYIYKTLVRTYLTYRNIEKICEFVKEESEVLTETETNYIKRILISNKTIFTYLDFLKICQIDITKQGAFKILNKFAALKVLSVVETKSKNKLFKLNPKCLLYKMN